MAPHPDNLLEPPTTSSRQAQRTLTVKLVMKVALLLIIAYAAGYYNVVPLGLSLPRWVTGRRHHVLCRPPLPPLKPQALDPGNSNIIKQASCKFDKYMKKFASLDGVDSVTVAIVTPDGPVFSKGYGVRRANETGVQREKVDEDTIYRLASVSKMFTVLELWILEEQGALKWYVTSLRLILRLFLIYLPLQGMTISPNTCLNFATPVEVGKIIGNHALNRPRGYHTQ